MIPPEERAKATLRAVVQYGKQRQRWPDLDEVRAFRKRIGCRATVYVTLARLRSLGLIELRGHATTARWAPTLPGFDLLHTPPFEPALELRQPRKDAALLLDVQPIRKTPAILTPAAAARFAPDLPVYE